MKIVSLLPSATEIVYALGLEDSLEGVTFECDFPREARRKPVISTTSMPIEEGTSQAEIDRIVAEKVGAGEPLYVLDEERIQEIQPDLILAQDLCRVCAVPSGQVTEALDKLGCRAEVISLDPNTLDEILQGIEIVGRATGQEARATEVVGGLRERVEAVRRTAAGLPRVRALALEWGDPPYNGGHWIPEMVSIAGGKDVLGVAGEPSRRISWAEVAGAAPQVIVYMPCGYGLTEAVDQGERLFAVGELGQTPAVRAGRVFATDSSSYFSRPGPRIVDGLEILAWALHPDALPEPPPGTVALLQPAPSSTR